MYREPTLDELRCEAARRFHLEFIRYCWQREDPLIVGYHTKRICERVDRAFREYRKGVSTFLTVKVPFRHGKSDIVSRYLPAHFLGEFPDNEVIVASYSASLSADFSKFARRLVREDRFGQVYPSVRLSKDEQSVDVWGIEGKLGKAHWTGLGGSITGKGGSCFPAGTLIKTDNGSVPIELLCGPMMKVVRVATVNHGTGRVEYKPIRAAKRRKANGIVRIVTDSNRSVNATGDHLFYVQGQGYKAASLLSKGDKIIAANAMSDLWRDKGAQDEEDVYCLLPADTQKISQAEVHVLRERVRKAWLRIRQDVATWTQGCLLQNRVLQKSSCDKACWEVSSLRDAKKEGCEVLLSRMPNRASTDGQAYTLSRMREGFSAKEQKEYLLLKGLCGSCSFKENAWKKQLPLQGGAKPRETVFGAKAVHTDARWKLLRDLWRSFVYSHCDAQRESSNSQDPSSTSYRSQSCKQYPGKFDNNVSRLSCCSSPFGSDTIYSVEPDGSGEVYVYDIQVEGNHNFFANEILVHNCIIVDDFLKNREEAESEVIREKVWDSFTNDLLTRRAPVCIVIVLATPWHTDDLFGRIKRAMGEDENFPKFEELRFPARDEGYREINGSEWLFPERFDDIWYEGQFASLGPYGSASLLQCDPVVRHGNLFRVDRVQLYDELPADTKLTRGWDLASSEKQRVKDDPDYTASIRLGVRWAPGPVQPVPVLFIDDYTCDRFAAPQRDAKIKGIAQADGPIEIGIEAYGPYKDAFTNLETALWGMRKVSKVQLPGDKVTRASVLEPSFHAGNVYMRRAAWNDELLRFLGEFPGGAHDDPVDALVTAFALHKPFVKHVWPNMMMVRAQPFDIHWGKKDERNALHYGSVVMKRDLSIWVVCTLWDDTAGVLFVYDNAWFDEPDVQKVTAWLTNHMRLNQYSVDRIVCNERMYNAPDETEKNMQVLFREEFRRRNIQARLNEPIHYDQLGAISQVNKLTIENKLYVNEVCEESLQQFSGWAIESNKPSNENNGYCEALCLVVSELKRKKVFDQRKRPADYLPKGQLQKALREDPILKGRSL